MDASDPLRSIVAALKLLTMSIVGAGISLEMESVPALGLMLAMYVFSLVWLYFSIRAWMETKRS